VLHIALTVKQGRRRKEMIRMLAASMVLALAASAGASIRITEWAYQGADGEFIEFTNIGIAPIDMTGWSFDDDSGTPGVFDLSAAGSLAPGESMVLTEAAEADFRLAWGIDPSITVLGDLTTNLGRNDEINLFDALDALIDRLTFGDQNFPGTIRTQNRSGNPLSAAALGANDVSQWGLSSVGDAFGSYTSAGGDIGNPGASIYVPEPASLGLLMIGGLAALRRGRR
jgi:predicted extracellular nuclease